MGCCGSLWDRCGSLWIVVGSLWVVVDRCGSLWVVPGFSNYASLTVYVNTFNFEVVRHSRFICSKKLSIFLVICGNLLVSVRLNVTL